METPSDHSWVYIVVQDPGGNEQFLGLKDEENEISFIPAFIKKEEAQDGFLNIPREKGKKYEIQAIIFEDLKKYAKENGLVVFILDGEGKVLKMVDA